MTHVFTYGSLMFPRVWTLVVKGSYQSRRGTVSGFARRRISGVGYPALVRSSPESTVAGVVYLDVSPEDLRTLDAFENEGTLYRRISLTVTLDRGETRDAIGYLYLKTEEVSDLPWDQAAFEREGLDHFLATYVKEHRPDQPDT